MNLPTRKARSHELTHVAARRRSFILSVVAASSITTTVAADYQGLQVQIQTNVTAGGQARSVYRLYVVCDDPGDFLSYVAGTPMLGNMVLQTLSSAGSAPGGIFWNAPGGHATAPTHEEIANMPDIEWDTFGTIGVASVPSFEADATRLPPGWSGIGDVTEINSDHTSWYTVGAQPQAMAGNGTALPGGLWGVLAMQLTVNAGNHVRGTVAIGVILNSPLAGGTNFYATNQTFNSFPAPGSWAVLGVAALAGRWRKRRN